MRTKHSASHNFDRSVFWFFFNSEGKLKKKKKKLLVKKIDHVKYVKILCTTVRAAESWDGLLTQVTFAAYLLFDKILNRWENYGPGWLNDRLNLRVYPP